MSEVLGRARAKRHAAGWRDGASRLYLRLRPRLAVAAAFSIACLLGFLAAGVGLGQLAALTAQAPPASSAP